MPAKPKSIAAAEKRTIKAEIKTLNGKLRRSDRELKLDLARIRKEIEKLKRAAARKLSQAGEENLKTLRRIAILEGRL